MVQVKLAHSMMCTSLCVRNLVKHRSCFCNSLVGRSREIQSGASACARQVWDLRKAEVAMTLKGHANTITGLRVSPDGTHLLSNAMVRPHGQAILHTTIM